MKKRILIVALLLVAAVSQVKSNAQECEGVRVKTSWWWEDWSLYSCSTYIYCSGTIDTVCLEVI